MKLQEEGGSILNLQGSSNKNLKTGLDVVGKLYLNSAEWTGKFAQRQFAHQ